MNQTIPGIDAFDIINEQQIDNRYDGDLEIIYAVAKLFCAEQVELLADLSAAIGASDREAVRRAAHAIRGSAYNMGASRVLLAAEVLELEAPDLEWERVVEVANLLVDESDSARAEVANRYPQAGY